MAEQEELVVRMDPDNRAFEARVLEMMKIAHKFGKQAGRG
jgi:hypothetical protein